MYKSVRHGVWQYRQVIAKVLGAAASCYSNTVQPHNLTHALPEICREAATLAHSGSARLGSRRSSEAGRSGKLDFWFSGGVESASYSGPLGGKPQLRPCGLKESGDSKLLVEFYPQ